MYRIDAIDACIDRYNPQRFAKKETANQSKQH